ncbi:MAG: glycosyltransferase [Phycisphaerae bacterium]
MERQSGSLCSKRILMVAPQPVFEPRGTPFSVVYRIRALCRAGHQVDLLTYPYGRDVNIRGLHIVRVPRLPMVRGVRIGPSIPKLMLDAMLVVWMAAMLVGRRYDCIWSHEEAGLFCGIASRIGRIPHVYDMHSDLSQQMRNYSRFDVALIRWVFDVLERTIIRLSDVVLVICQDLLETARAKARSKPVFLVENYCTEVDFLDDQAPDPAELRQAHQLDGRTVVLYIGSLEPYQGIDLLMGAVAYLGRRKIACRLLVVGGRDVQVEALRREVDRQKLGHAVDVVGTVSPAAVQSYIEVSDILVTARSRGTNVPLKLYSYMKSGKPIVATNIYSHTQLLDDKTALLVEPEAQALGRGIERLVGDGALRERLSCSARVKAAAFADDCFERRIQSALDSACKRGRQ